MLVSYEIFVSDADDGADGDTIEEKRFWETFCGNFISLWCFVLKV